MFTAYGHFSDDGRRFLIHTPDIPRNWYNYFYTDHYVTFTSQCGIGQGFLQDDLGRRLMPVKARGLYAMCGNHNWNLCALPVYEANEAYECEHGLGYTTIRLQKHGILSEYTLFVPREEDPMTGLEVSIVRLVNRTQSAQTVRVISYTENDFDGSYRYQAYNTSSVNKEEDFPGIRYRFSEEFYGQKRPFTFFHASGSPLSGWDCARNAFIGTYGTLADPAALHRGGCSQSACVAEKMGFAVQTDLSLAPGEEKSVTFVTGITGSPERARTLANRFDSAEKALRELEETRSEISGRLDETLRFETEDRNLDHLLNHWLKYQTDLGSRWARVRHNGYRDIASDTECLACFNPGLAWERIKRLLCYQYSSGYAPRTFIDGEIRPNNFADCTVWLTFTVNYIIRELGDVSLLNEEVTFNDGSRASVYEHLRRSVEYLYNFTGSYGLIQIWGGDWNDCMNTAGLKHKGVSVWLSIAWVRACRQLEYLASALGKEEDAALCRERSAKMCDLINRYGWDEEGGYYMYARSDDDSLIGSASCDEGKVFLNPQLWAVLAGGLGEGREEAALENAYSLLADPLGTRVSWPPYTEKTAWIGSVSQKAPGVQENGGVYLHAMCWKLAVDAMRGDEVRVREDIDSIVPFRNPVVAGRAEPYIICNCYMGKETGYRYGTPGQSWRTASGQWFLKSMAQFVFGFQPELEGLAVRPCMPAGWNEMKATRIFRGQTYRVTVKRTGQRSVSFNGRVLSSDILPLSDGEVLVTV